MYSEGNSLKPNNELTKFTKHSKLAFELRHHILTYCNSETQVNYGECSNFCNMEIRRFNTTPPFSLDIEEKIGHIVVKMHYLKNHLKIIKKFWFSDSEDVMKEVQKYVMKYYKYVGQKTTAHVKIEVKNWPIDLMKMMNLMNIKNLEVTIYKSMCDDFMDYFKNSDLHISHLTLYDADEVSDQAIISSDFFKADAFRNLRLASIFVQCEIDKENFVDMEKDYVLLKSSQSFDAVRAKVRKWNNTNRLRDASIRIRLPENDDRVLNSSVIFPSDQFDILPIQSRSLEKFCVGKVVVEIEQNENGTMMRLNLKENPKYLVDSDSDDDL